MRVTYQNLNFSTVRICLFSLFYYRAETLYTIQNPIVFNILNQQISENTNEIIKTIKISSTKQIKNPICVQPSSLTPFKKLTFYVTEPTYYLFAPFSASDVCLSSARFGVCRVFWYKPCVCVFLLCVVVGSVEVVLLAAGLVSCPPRSCLTIWPLGRSGANAEGFSIWLVRAVALTRGVKGQPARAESAKIRSSSLDNEIMV